MSLGKPMLKLEDVRKRFGTLEVLCGISMGILKGEIIGIIGPSGCGKSTLLRCINFLGPANKGKIYLDGELMGYKVNEKDGSLKKLKDSEISKMRSQVGMVFQLFNLWQHKTALENVIEGPIMVKRKPRKEAIDLAKSLLDRVGVIDKVNEYPSTLSGGQQQRVAIARALAMEPKVMMFDEATSALDPECVNEVLEVILKLAKSGMTMLIVTHEMGFAREVCDNIKFIFNGRIEEEGPPRKIFTDPDSTKLNQFLSLINKKQ